MSLINPGNNAVPFAVSSDGGSRSAGAAEPRTKEPLTLTRYAGKPVAAALLPGDGSVYTGPLYEAMANIKEDPWEYRLMLQQLVRAHRPHNAAERMLVEDIAWLRWQKRRNQRAQAGLLMQSHRRLITERTQRRLELRREMWNAPAAQVEQHGLMSLPDTPSKFVKVRKLLDQLIEQARAQDFLSDAEPALTELYGQERATMRATTLTNRFRKLRRLAEEKEASRQRGDPGATPAQSERRGGSGGGRNLSDRGVDRRAAGGDREQRALPRGGSQDYSRSREPQFSARKG